MSSESGSSAELQVRCQSQNAPHALVSSPASRSTSTSALDQLTNDDICEINNFPSLIPLRKYGMYVYKWQNDGVYWTHFGLLLLPDIVNFFTIRNGKRLKEIESKTKSPLVIENDIIGGKINSFIVFYRGSIPYCHDGIHDFTVVENMTEALKQICSFILSIVMSNQDKTSKDSEATPSSPSNSASSDRRSFSCGSTTSSSDDKYTIIKRESKEFKGTNFYSETVKIPYYSIGWVFGKRGLRISSIMKKTDTSITLCSTNKLNTKLLVQSNDRNKVDKGVKSILEAVAEIGIDS